MIKTVEQFLTEHNLNTPDKTFLVGFSGGCDSLCLLDILHCLSEKFGYKLIALHLNHNWRGEESKAEELNCIQFCERMWIEIITETLEAKTPKSESSARDARYSFFLKHASNYSNSAIFTAHTRTDNAETLIYRLAKGTGVKGLQGIPEKRFIEKIPIYRPLLQISRKQIENYCISKGLVANNDSSNLDISYKRNFIRHKIMPLFDEINFHAEKSIASLASLAISQTNIVDEYIALLKKDLFDDEKVLTAKFMQLSEDVQKKIIYDACLKKDIEYDFKKIEKILEFIKANSHSKSGSRHSIANDLWLFVNSKHIYLITKTKGEQNTSEVTVTTEGDYPIIETTKIFSIQKFEQNDEKLKFPCESELFAYVEFKDLDMKFTLRTRREGDFIAPFGMTGSMKLKKYLNSKGISLHEKDELILLCQGSEVLWIAGVGLSNKLKVTNQPSHVIKLFDRN